MADAQAPVPFRAFRSLVRFRLKSGKVLTRLRADPDSPPYGATHWFDGFEWRADFGGEWIAITGGRLIWRWE